MDDLSSLLGGASGGSSIDTSQLGSLASAVQDEGGLDGLIGKLQASGLDREVDSWVGTGPNQAVDPQRLGAALGPDEVQRLSAKSGIDIAALLPLLAAFLPQIIDMLTPGGQVPAGGLGQGGEGSPDLGGLLGGLMGTAGGGAGSTAGLDDLLGGLGGLLGGDKDR